MSTQSLKIKDIEIHIKIEGNGPHLTLIHGVGARLESWNSVVELLKENFTIVRYDLRGHGATTKPKGPYSIALFSEDLAALLKHLGIGRTHLVGFSLGGLIAQCFALEHPNTVNRLVILSAVANKTKNEMEILRKRADALMKSGNTPDLEAALERWFTPEFRQTHPELVNERIRLSQQNDPDAFAAAYRAFVEGDFGNKLTEIPHPTLVITGECDPGSNIRMAQFMHNAIPDSELCIIPNLRHNILVEGPNVVAGQLQSFLD